MAWVKIDDQFSDHPKVLEVGPLAECLFVRGLTYASRYLTDGFVPASHLRRMGDLDAFAEAGKLVGAGLWIEAENGYQIHDYLDYQPSAEKVKAEREAARIRMELARAAKQSGNKPQRSPEVRPNNSRSSHNPDPTRPTKEVPNGTSDIPPTPQKRKRKGELTDEQRSRFDRWYAAYPRKVKPVEAVKAWAGIDPQPSEDMTDRMIAKVREWAASDEWDDPKYIPYPASWLNAGRWDDGPPTSRKAVPNGSLRLVNAGRSNGEAASEDEWDEWRRARNIPTSKRNYTTDEPDDVIEVKANVR